MNRFDDEYMMSCPNCHASITRLEFKYLHRCPIVWREIVRHKRWHGFENGRLVAVVRKPNIFGYWLAKISIGGEWHNVQQERAGPDYTPKHTREIDSWAGFREIRELVQRSFESMGGTVS